MLVGFIIGFTWIEKINQIACNFLPKTHAKKSELAVIGGERETLLVREKASSPP